MGNELIELSGKEAILCNIGASGRKRVEKTVNLTDLFEKVREQWGKNGVTETPIMPIGTKAYFRDGSREVLVFEEMPRTRTILTSQGTYTLAFPFVVYFFYFEDGYMPEYTSRLFYRTAPLTSLSDELLVCNLTHVNSKETSYKIGSVCMKASLNRRDELEKKIAANMKYYWTTEFSYSNWNAFFEGPQTTQDIKQLASLSDWQKASQKDPLFVLEIPWKKARKTAQQVLEEYRVDINKKPKAISQADQLADLMQQLREAK